MPGGGSSANISTTSQSVSVGITVRNIFILLFADVAASASSLPWGELLAPPHVAPAGRFFFFSCKPLGSFFSLALGL